MELKELQIIYKNLSDRHEQLLNEIDLTIDKIGRREIIRLQEMWALENKFNKYLNTINDSLRLKKISKRCQDIIQFVQKELGNDSYFRETIKNNKKNADKEEI